MNSLELYEAANLRGALDAARTAVDASPRDTAQRLLFAELLCFAGQWQLASEQFEWLGQQVPTLEDECHRYRQLTRAEVERQRVFQHGGSPEFIGEPTPALRSHQEALACLRAGQDAAAVQWLAQAAAQRPPVAGYCDVEEFQAFRDMDDLTASFLEVFTTGGQYFWIPLEAIVSVDLPRPQRPIDQLWRQAHVLLSGGSEADAFLPALYPLSFLADNDALRLGRDTDWVGQEGEPVRGVGLRVFLVGDQDRTILAVDSLRFHAPV